MPHLRHERVLLEGVDQALQIGDIFRRAPERPRKLHQHAAQLTDVDQRLQPLAVLLNRHTIQLLVVRESAVQLGRKAKVGETLQLLRPDSGQLGPERVVERAVDFDDRKETGKVLRLVESLWTPIRVHNPVPIPI